MGKTTPKKKTQEPVVAATPQLEPNTPAIKLSKPKTVTITIKLADKTYIGIGSTTLKALQAIEKPKKIASKCFVTVEYGGKSTQRFFRPQQVNRLFFTSPSLQIIHAKSLSVGLPHGITIA